MPDGEMQEMEYSSPNQVFNKNSEGMSNGEMYRYFYFSDKVGLLFKDWAPHSPVTFALTLGAVMILAVFYEWFADIQRRAQWMLQHGTGNMFSGAAGSFGSADSASQQAASGGKRASQHVQVLLSHRFVRLLLVALVYMVHSAIGYLLMLAVMTFNVGVFLSVLVGLGIGFVLFRVNHL